MVTSCRYCSEPLYFERNSNGKFVPYEQNTRDIHDCPRRESSYSSFSSYNNNYDSNNNTITDSESAKTYYAENEKTCDYCKKRIWFDPNVKSRAGKFIPLSYDTGDKHACSGNPYYSNSKNNKIKFFDKFNNTGRLVSDANRIK